MKWNPVPKSRESKQARFRATSKQRGWFDCLFLQTSACMFCIGIHAASFCERLFQGSVPGLEKYSNSP